MAADAHAQRDAIAKSSPAAVPGALQPAKEEEVAEEKGEAMCLSMHQPWASLLVAGIKRVEGRSWPTKHRGTLWIASTAQEPSDLEVAQVPRPGRV